MFRFNTILAAAILLTGPSAGRAADSLPATPNATPDLPERARNAITRYASTNLEDWHYTREWDYQDTVRVDRHDPSMPGPEHWQLVSIDGREPTAEEIEDYNKDRNSHEDKSEERFDNKDVMKMIAPGSVTLVEQNDQKQVYSYRMQSPNGKKKRVYQAMLGDMTLVEDGEESWVELVRVWNDVPVRPIFGVKLHDVTLDFHFTRQGETVLPAGADIRFAGRILFVKEIERQFRVRLTDFTPVSDVTASQ